MQRPTAGGPEVRSVVTEVDERRPAGNDDRVATGAAHLVTADEQSPDPAFAAGAGTEHLDAQLVVAEPSRLDRGPTPPEHGRTVAGPGQASTSENRIVTPPVARPNTAGNSRPASGVATAAHAAP